MKLKDLKLVHIAFGLFFIVSIAVLATQQNSISQLEESLTRTNTHWQIMEGEYMDSIAKNERALEILETEISITQNKLVQSFGESEKLEIIIANLHTDLHALKQELTDTKTMLDVCSNQCSNQNQ